MALLYWLPLTKDLSQNGIAGESITNHGSVINASGKLGSCYEFGSSKWAECPGTAMKTITECSYSLWIKMGTLSAYNMYIFASTGSTTWQAYIFALTRPYNDSSTRKLGLTISNGSTATTAQYVTNTVFELNTWYHVAATYKAGEIKLYVNGELDATYATTIVPKFSSISKLSLGAGPSGSYTSQSFMNDIRIYDECLSAKQIKEISKGLYFHILLNHLGYNNLLSGNPEKTNSWTPEGVTLTQDGDALKIVTGTQSAMRIYNSLSNVWLVDGDTYTVSFWAKAAQANTVLRWSRSIAGYFPDCPITTQWAYYEVTGSISGTSNDGTLSLQGSGTYWIKHVKLERNSFATKFCLPRQNIENETAIYDVSGFNGVGVKNGTTLIPIVPSPRYNYCTKFDGSSYFRFNSPAIGPMTVSLWVCWNSVTTGQSIIFIDNNRYIGLGLLSSSAAGRLCCSSRVNSSCYPANNLVANTWYHFVIVCPNGATQGERTLYINGELQTAASNVNNWNAGGTQFEIGRRSSSNDGFNGKMSDFRMYATALSAADVLELYQTSMEIDANGNILPRQLTT